MSTRRRGRRSWRPLSGSEPSPPSSPADQPSLALVLGHLSRIDDWWGDARDEDAVRWTETLEERYHRLWEMKDWEGDDVEYGEARVAYRVGRLAAEHPRLGSEPFGRVADALKEGWTGETSFERVRRYVQLGFERRRFSAELLRIRQRVGELERRWRER